jgi:UDP-3-O-[3-hydroxymyristoyl] glucosamine N-acyltransferase
MADTRFFSNSGPFALQEIVSLSGAQIAGNGDISARQIHDIAPLQNAGVNDLSFFDNSKYLEPFKASKAGACFIKPRFVALAPKSMIALVTDDPYLAYTKTARHFYPTQALSPGIHPSAIIADSATIAKTASIAAGAVIGAHASIGEHVTIGANAVIAPHVSIDENSQIGALSSISHAIIGARVIIHCGAKIGQDGFGYAIGKTGHLKVPQLGRVLIEDDVEIGANATIDRGSGPDTTIGRGVKIDNLVQLGHNVQVGAHAMIIAQVGVSGSTKIGDGAVLAGQVGVSGHINIGKGARAAAQSGVITDIPDGQTYGGYPAMPVREWHKQTIRLKQWSKQKRGKDA